MKKILLGALVVLAVGLVGCQAMTEGNVGDNIGSEGKYRIFTIAQRGDKSLGTTRNDTEKRYVRVFKQFGNVEMVTDATCTIEATNLSDWGDSVTALMFGFDKSAGNYSYYILGIMPNGAEKNKYYLEHYENVPKGELDVSAEEATVVSEFTEKDGKKTYNIYKYDAASTDKFVAGQMAWTSLPSGSYTTGTNGTTYVISITQEENASKIMEYIVKVGGKEIARWPSKRFNNPLGDNKKDPQGLAAYANIKKGTGVTCNWQLDKDSVQGSLFAAPATDNQPEGSDLLYFAEK